MPDGVARGGAGEKLRGATDHTYGSKLTNQPMPFGVASGVASPSFGVAMATPGHPSDTPLAGPRREKSRKSLDQCA